MECGVDGAISGEGGTPIEEFGLLWRYASEWLPPWKEGFPVGML